MISGSVKTPLHITIYKPLQVVMNVCHQAVISLEVFEGRENLLVLCQKSATPLLLNMRSLSMHKTYSQPLLWQGKAREGGKKSTSKRLRKAHRGRRGIWQRNRLVCFQEKKFQHKQVVH